MKKYLMMIYLIISISNSFAQNSVILNEGDIAPFRGHLVKSEKLEELIKSDKQKPLLEAKFEAQKDLTAYHKDMAREARGKLLGSEIQGNMKLIGGFVLGVIITGFAMKINNKIGDI